MAEEQLDGGSTGGAVRSGDTVRRAAGPWTPAVHALLTHLAAKDFPGTPRPLGFDDEGREVLTFIEGETVGSRKPWPAWTHAEDTLDQVARWMRAYHQAVADFVPPPLSTTQRSSSSCWSTPSPSPTRSTTTPVTTAAESINHGDSHHRASDSYRRASQR